MTSYQEAAKAIPSKSKISKTTVMNKVHGIADVIPFVPREEPKTCEYLFIEADEDHVAEQHGREGHVSSVLSARLSKRGHSPLFTLFHVLN